MTQVVVSATLMLSLARPVAPLYCWGDGAGDFATDKCFHVDEYNPCALRPVDMHLRNVVQVSDGFVHTCALSASGAAYCWGYNDAGAVGRGPRTMVGAPTAVLK
jgi:alpha-tubulin suppressor-like RCC1 family protein